MGLDGAWTRPDGSAACKLLLSARALVAGPPQDTGIATDCDFETEPFQYVHVLFIIYVIIQNCKDWLGWKDRVSHFVAQLPLPSVALHQKT